MMRLRNHVRCASVAALVIWGLGTICQAEELQGPVWLISTRELDGCSDTAAQPSYWLLGPDRQWQQAGAEAFLNSDAKGMPTVFYVHGNRTDRCEAVSIGMDFFACLQRCAPGRPFRAVIWTWPADRISTRVRPDVQTKALRSDAESRYLARCLAQLRPDVPVSLVGYSMGARTIGGAMHLLAQGTTQTPAAPQATSGKRIPLRAVLIASASDESAFCVNGAHGMALSQADRVLVAYNPCDSVLRWYPLLWRRGGPEALGYSGPACCGTSVSEGNKLELLNVACEVGREHDWNLYLASPSLQARLAFYTFLAPEAAY